jgi:4-carboxymuconolactone decarboxylase
MTTAPTIAPSRYERGYAILGQLAGDPSSGVLDDVADIAPDLGRYVVEFGYGDVHARPELSIRDRQLAAIAALTALGHAAPQLRFHIDGALNVGCSPREVVEAIVHVCIYAGFPSSLNALTVAKEAFAARPATAGERERLLEVTAAPDNRYARGWAALAEIDGEAGEKVIASLRDIAPDLARYIVEFAFGDVYRRPGLDLRLREIVTIAACAALGTARPQLKVHVHGLLNVGGTRLDAVETLIQMAVHAGFPAALNGLAAAREVFDERRALQDRE